MAKSLEKIILKLWLKGDLKKVFQGVVLFVILGQKSLGFRGVFINNFFLFLVGLGSLNLYRQEHRNSESLSNFTKVSLTPKMEFRHG